jgi:opacity protein-like surface antigen
VVTNQKVYILVILIKIRRFKMIAKHNIPRKGFGKKLGAGLCALVSSVAGCFSGGSVEGFVGSHAPTSQRATTVEAGNSIDYGVRAKVKTKAKVGFEVGFSGHEATGENAVQINEVEAQDVSVGVSYPIWSNETVSVDVNAGAKTRTESETVESKIIPFSYSEDRSASGWYAGVGVEWKPVQHLSVGARVDWQGFGEGSYEEAGNTASVSVGYSF